VTDTVHMLQCTKFL